MAWWWWAYLVVLATTGVAGMVLDLVDREPPWFIAGQLMSTSSLVFFTLSANHPSVGEPLGLWALPLLLAALVWDAFEVRRDLKDLDTTDPATSRLVFGLVTAVVIPGFGCGGVLVLRALS